MKTGIIFAMAFICFINVCELIGDAFTPEPTAMELQIAADQRWAHERRTPLSERRASKGQYVEGLSIGSVLDQMPGHRPYVQQQVQSQGQGSFDYNAAEWASSGSHDISGFIGGR